MWEGVRYAADQENVVPSLQSSPVSLSLLEKETQPRPDAQVSIVPNRCCQVLAVTGWRNVLAYNAMTLSGSFRLTATEKSCFVINVDQNN
jgi:hypothetical protein